MEVGKNIQEVLGDIEKYSPYAKNVKLVVVTKYVDSLIIKEVLKTGVNILGENRVQVLQEKNEELSKNNLSVKWHFIGNLQKNKVKYIASYIDMIHSVNKLTLAKEIDKRAKENNRIIETLLEINIYGEESKEGYKLEELLKNLPELLKLENIKIVGLMTMAPFTDDENIQRMVFKKLGVIKDELNETYFENSLTELSMGMSNDYKIALEEGATLIRVGSKIFK
ncbi:YggS family pyridoxal phosphate-dependent enzyme [Cetobacterium sp. 2A]|uniref:YggS family pyridoxal phosphate-dependent enzyme n=1 Tax=Cetobacterium sp. 2A TaxID=2754723 RepID=UPI00163C9330|nr:YggS family pyridoxal phosphate-dependent enzyme [Cetobacterium sp. 2A]MBC2856514.1 YggS family pyridoxal phosphate-dependent enzyme [Cetobacterium sp. 2A]